MIRAEFSRNVRAHAVLGLIATLLVLITFQVQVSQQAASQLPLNLVTPATATTTASGQDEPESSATNQETPNTEAAPTSTTEATEVGEPDPVCGLTLSRLPGWVKPIHYDLVVMPDLPSLIFQGIVQIDVQMQEANISRSESQNQIVLHADESLTVAEIWFSTLAGKRVAAAEPTNEYMEIESICRDPSQQLIVITLVKELPKNSVGQLHLTFAGRLSNELRGFYRSGYQFRGDARSPPSRRYIGLTQFQALEARKAFPCFDEPALKATFNLTMIGKPVDRLMLSNMEPLFERLISLNDTEEDGAKMSQRKLVKFKQTPPMSTYVFAFIVGEFDFVEENYTSDWRNLPVRLYTPPGKRDQGWFAANMARKGLSKMEQTLRINYTLNKLDLVSVADFEAGAMENWGLLTFKEMQLLYDQENTSEETRALIAGTVLHELVHQWFGNLVTMDWWNDLWLNEGFATYFEYRFTGELLYEAASEDYYYYYLINSHIHALNEDSFRQIHAVEPELELIDDQADVDELFDAISYNKAASVIRMIGEELFPGDDSGEFLTKLRNYLNKFKLKTATQDDLIEALELPPESTELIRSWLNQAGHPMLNVSLAGQGNGNGPRETLMIEQSRFVQGTAKLDEREDRQLWIVPITLLCVDSSQPNRSELLRFRLETKQMSYKLPAWFDARNQNHWLKLNANFTGFYRVLYAPELFGKFYEAIRLNQVSIGDRLNLLDEAHTLFISNKLPASQLVKLVNSFQAERNGAVIDTLTSAMNGLYRLYEFDMEANFKLIGFIKQLLGRIYRDNYENIYSPGREDSRNASKLTNSIGFSSLMNALIFLNDTQTVEDTLNLFKFTKKQLLPLPLRKSVYMAVSKFGSEEDFKRLVFLFGKTPSKEEKIRLAKAMAKSNSPKRLEFTYNWLRKLTNDEVGPPTSSNDFDRIEILSSMLNTKAGRDLVARLLDGDLNGLVELNNGRAVNSLVEELALSMDPAEINSKLGRLFVRNRSSSDWLSSLDYIRRMLRWQELVKLRVGSTPRDVAEVLDIVLTNNK